MMTPDSVSVFIQTGKTNGTVIEMREFKFYRSQVVELAREYKSSGLSMESTISVYAPDIFGFEDSEKWVGAIVGILQDIDLIDRGEYPRKRLVFPGNEAWIYDIKKAMGELSKIDPTNTAV